MNTTLRNSTVFKRYGASSVLILSIVMFSNICYSQEDKIKQPEPVEFKRTEFKSVKVTRIAPIPSTFPKIHRDAFDRYCQVVAPNGKPINIFAQPEISDAQLRRVRGVMVHYLTDFPGSKFGMNKGQIANRMADNHATMMILKGSDGQHRPPRINAQPLYDTETVVDGSAAYIKNDFRRHRDATLEEILHCVHDNGIGVDVGHEPKGVLPQFQKQIRLATTHAMKNEIWPADDGQSGDWINELRNEGSLTQEYLASVIDTYYGLWGAFDRDVGMFGIYIARRREDLRNKDPQGLAVVEQFFHPWLTYDAEIDSSFRGTFSMNFDSKKPYTHKSRYLVNARLTGMHPSNLMGNDQDNQLAGNSANNKINGGKGQDTVVYPNAKSHYKIQRNSDGTITVTGDGIDTLTGIEKLVFDGDRLETKRFVKPVAPNLGAEDPRRGSEEEGPGEDQEERDQEQLESIFKQLDANNDGKLKRDEIPEEDRSHFDRTDVNKDGFLTLKELANSISNDENQDDEDGDEDGDEEQTGVIDRQQSSPKASVDQLAVLNKQEKIDANTKWNVQQMSKRDCRITKNEQGYYEATFAGDFVLVFVPQGSFSMGSNSLKLLDRPVHDVGLSGFWIAKYLVTNGQFKQFVDTTGFKTDAERPKAQGPYVYNFRERYFKPTPGRNWRDAFKNHVATHPVVAVSWHDSQAYCRWLGKKWDLPISLPTESQWEKAARGTDGRKYPWGNDPPNGTQANFCDAQFAKAYPQARQGNPDLRSDDGYPGLSPVDAFPKGASPYGVFDMGGNVSNWVQDWKAKYPNHAVIDPAGPVQGQDRCMRGGFWVADAGLTKDSIEEQHNLRSACRSADDPHSSDDHLGFRFAMIFKGQSSRNQDQVKQRR